jgi:hypothetical protein
MPLPEDVLDWICSNIAADERKTAISLLESAVTHEGTPPEPRLLRCAAVASRGEIERLRRNVERLRIDYRDVIMAGEYEVENSKLKRVRDLSLPIPGGRGGADSGNR